MKSNSIYCVSFFDCSGGCLKEFFVDSVDDSCLTSFACIGSALCADSVSVDVILLSSFCDVSSLCSVLNLGECGLSSSIVLSRSFYCTVF